MRNNYIYLVSALLVIGCTDGLVVPESPSSPVQDPSIIDLSCRFETTPIGNKSAIPTKTLIGKPSNQGELICNFIKVDETRIEGQTPEEYEYDESYIDLSKAAIVNGIVRPADNTNKGTNADYDYFFRTIQFNPALSYQFNVPVGEIPTESNVTGYASALVGWYPATEDVSTSGEGSNTLFSATNSYTVDENGKVCVTFKNKLDGETDLMVSDLREGRFNKKEVGFKNNDSDRDIQPFGHDWVDFEHFDKGFKYRNYMSFKHYLTAVRLYLSVSDANLSLLSWGRINDVVFTNQPSTAVVELPTSQNRGTKTPADGFVNPIDNTTCTLPCEGVDPTFGKVVKWADSTDFHIIRTPIFQNDPDYPEMNVEVPDYPIEAEQGTSMDRKPLGYCLIKPYEEGEEDAVVEIHTDAGIIRVPIPHLADYVDKEGNQHNNVPILEAGYIYNLTIKINTEDNIEVVVGNRDKESFRNLSPYNTVINDFEDSNCYIINKDIMYNQTARKYYEGFYFHAYTPGRGKRGAVASAPYPGNMIFAPSYVEILWQDASRPITSIELVNGYCRFTLNEKCYNETNPLEGNAVIAAYNDDDEIIWSWHIWITSQIKDYSYNVDYKRYEDYPYASLAGSMSTRFYGQEYGEQRYGFEFSMMNMNLGATACSDDSEDNVLKSYGLYYQWGRKDPSPGPPSYNYGLKTLSTAKYLTNNGYSDFVYEHLDDEATITTGIRYPLALIDPSSRNYTYANDWTLKTNDELWGYSTADKKVTNKTIYDPCPYGYRVADEEIHALFYANFDNFTKSDYGIKIGDNFFPYTGWKGHVKGRADRTHAWFHAGDMADYQDARISKFTSTADGGYYNHRGASIISQNSVYTIGIGTYDAGISLSYANRTTAAPVRCVRYNADGEEPADPDR